MPTKKTTPAAPKAKKPVAAPPADAPVLKPARKPAAPKAKAKAPELALPEQIRQIAVESLDSDKAEDIVSYDLKGVSSLADYVIIASGNSARQLSAMAEHVSDKISALGRKARVEGKASGDWVLLDTGDVIIHLMRPEMRQVYQLESLWSPEALGAAALQAAKAAKPAARKPRATKKAD